MKQLIYTLIFITLFSCKEEEIIPVTSEITSPINSEDIIKGMPVTISVTFSPPVVSTIKLYINGIDTKDLMEVEETGYYDESCYDSINDSFTINYYWNTSNCDSGSKTIKMLVTDTNGFQIEDEVTVDIIKLPEITNSSFTDSRDGTSYPTVQIGNQIWMAKNLAYLPSVSKLSIGSDTEPHYYVNAYNGTNINEAKATDNFKTYGVLYNWSAAMNVCPSGWHLPDYNEWLILSKVLSANGFGYGGSGEDIAKALAATTNWQKSSIDPSVIGYDLSTNNLSGFSALPGGSCAVSYIINDASNGNWWTSTENNSQMVWSCWLDSNSPELVFINGNENATGYSVRCISDN